MSTISILGSEETDTCAKIDFKTLSKEIDRWLGDYFRVAKTLPRGDSPLNLWTRLARGGQRDLACVHLGELLRLAGAHSVESEECGFHVVWPGATPWRVVACELDLIAAGGDEPPLVAIRDEAAACYVIVLPLELFEHISQDDVYRAVDIERRNKLSKRRAAIDFTADDAFVQDLRLRVLRVLQRSLEDSPTARLLKSMSMPMTPATDDELLSDGPSLGQDEEHFLTALDADLHSHWQAVAQ